MSGLGCTAYIICTRIKQLIPMIPGLLVEPPGWMIHQAPAQSEIPRFIKDIADDPVYQFYKKYFLNQVALGVLLFLLGGWSFVVWEFCPLSGVPLPGCQCNT